MADVKFRVVTATLNTSTGTQDITLSGFGTPTAAIAIWGGDSDGTQRTDGGTLGIGFTDGTNEYCWAWASEDNVSTSDTHRLGRNDRFIDTLNVTTGGNESVISFSAWITDGVRINLAVAPSATRTVTIILIGGTDTTNALAGSISLGTGTSAIDITAPGFEPDLVFFATHGNTGYSSGSGPNAIASIGICHNDGSDTQRGVSFWDEDAQTTTDVGCYFSSSTVGGQVFNGSVTWLATIGTFDASGFSVTPSANSGNDVMGYLALKFSNSPDISLDTLDGPTSTGDYSTTSPGFEPDFALMFLSDNTSIDTIQSGESIGISAFDATNQSNVSYSSQDAQSTSNAASQYHSTPVDDLTDGTTSLHVGTFSSFDTNGFTLNFTTAPGTARKWAALTIGPGAGAPPPAVTEIPPQLHMLDSQFATIKAHRLGGVIEQ